MTYAIGREQTCKVCGDKAYLNFTKSMEHKIVIAMNVHIDGNDYVLQIPINGPMNDSQINEMFHKMRQGFKAALHLAK